jgi:DNA-binding NtrC family response regulator
MHFLDGVIEIGIIEVVIQIKLLRVLVEQFAAGLGDGNDLEIRTMLVVFEKTRGVAVDEAGDDDM